MPNQIQYVGFSINAGAISLRGPSSQTSSSLLKHIKRRKSKRLAIPLKLHQILLLIQQNDRHLEPLQLLQGANYDTQLTKLLVIPPN